MKQDAYGRFTMRDKCIFRPLYEKSDMHLVKYSQVLKKGDTFCCYCGKDLQYQYFELL